MKKITLIILFLGSFCAFAQTPVTPQIVGGDFMKGMQHAKMHASKLNRQTSAMNKRGPKVSTYFNYTNSLFDVTRSFNASRDAFVSTIFDDTFVKIIYKDATTSAPSPQYIRFCSLGSCFDPRDSVFANDQDTLTDAVGPKDTFTVDTVLYPCVYTRHTDSTIVDTVFFHVTKLKPDESFTFAGPPKTYFGALKWDTLTGLPLSADTMFTVLLRSRDTSTRRYTYLGGKIGWTVYPGEVVASTITFKSGKKARLNDTIANYAEPTKQPKYTLNQLAVEMVVDVKKTPLLTDNNGMIINFQQRYKGTWLLSSSYSPRYLPGSDFTTPLYPVSFYKTTYTSFIVNGIDEASKRDGYALGNLYPNPATGGISTLEFATGKSGNVSIDIYNLVGQKLMTVASGTYASGNHKVNVNTEAMKSGMYLYTITANGFTQTKKFTVAN
jgi:hypothetical protein